MRHIEITKNKTFDDNDAGVLQRVTAAAILKIPAGKFIVNDWIDVFRDSTATVSVVAESTSVTLSSIGANISKRCGFARYLKISDNRWIGWGDLAT